MTRDRALAREWLERFEGAGLDGVIAKPEDVSYQPGKRAMFKIKHARTADCVVAGFRWHKTGEGIDRIAPARSLRRQRRRCITSASRRRLRWRVRKRAGEGARAAARKRARWTIPGANGRKRTDSSRMPGGQSRWSAGKDLSWEPLRIERVCEVKYDHLQGDRFRHATIFLRWRPDKEPKDCRYDQLEVTTPFELEKVFDASSRYKRARVGPGLIGPSGDRRSRSGASSSWPRAWRIASTSQSIRDVPASRVHVRIARSRVVNVMGRAAS